jgi:hypothetical protein
MKKNILYAVLAVVVLAVLAGFTLIRNSDDKAGDKKENKAGDEPKIGIHSIKALAESDLPLMCEYSQGSGPAGQLDNGDVIFYADAGKVRLDAIPGEASGAASGNDSAVHIIIDTDIEYVWSENNGKNKTGTMYDLVRIGNGELEVPEPGKIVIVEQERELECVPWTANESVFSVPSDVIFFEYPATGETEPEI